MGPPKSVEHVESLGESRGSLRQPASEDRLKSTQRLGENAAAFALPRAKLRLRIHQVEPGKQRHDSTQMIRRPCQHFKRPNQSRVKMRTQRRVAVGVE